VLIHKLGKNYIPIKQVNLINVFSNITLNKNTLGIFNNYGITVNFFNYYGNYIGSFVPKNPRYGKVILEQVLHYKDDIKRYEIAKEMFLSNAHNTLSVLKYYNKKYNNLINNIDNIEKLINQFNIMDENKIDKLLISEARIKQEYYNSFSKIIRNNNFNFSVRSKNPPKDEVNAMLSFGYAILYSIIENAIYRSSLDISFPFFHSNIRRKGGLQFDIADIFKPVLIDRLVFRLINKRQINRDHFTEHKCGVYLNKIGSQILIEEIESLMRSTISVYGSKNKLSYNQLISKEIHKLTNHFKNKENYKGFRMGW